jgi:hypothetical protein
LPNPSDPSDLKQREIKEPRGYIAPTPDMGTSLPTIPNDFTQTGQQSVSHFQLQIAVLTHNKGECHSPACGITLYAAMPFAFPDMPAQAGFPALPNFPLMFPPAR